MDFTFAFLRRIFMESSLMCSLRFSSCLIAQISCPLCWLLHHSIEGREAWKKHSLFNSWTWICECHFYSKCLNHSLYCSYVSNFPHGGGKELTLNSILYNHTANSSFDWCAFCSWMLGINRLLLSATCGQNSVWKVSYWLFLYKMLCLFSPPFNRV